MLNRLESSDFAPYLNQMVQIKTESGEEIELELREVTEMGSDSSINDMTGERKPFSVVFRGSPELVLSQSMYDIEFKQIGTLSIFIVPIGPDNEGMLYQAVFN